MPRPDNAVVHLAAAVQKLGTYQVPAQPNTIVAALFRATRENRRTTKSQNGCARSSSPSARTWRYKHLSDMSPMWNSMLRDTIAPTMLQAGVRVNVIPSEATANLNVRMLPGHSIEELIGQFGKIVNDPQIRFPACAGFG